MNPRNLRDHTEKLNAFVEICRAKSFHKAARNLGVSQPSLSQVVRILEDILQARLFVRSQRGITMTPAGQELYYFSERLTSEVDGIENRLRSPQQPMAGSIAIGAYASLTTYLLPRFLVQMSKKYDQMTLGLITLRSDELVHALSSRRCHFVIGSARFDQKTLTQVELYQDQFGFYRGKVPLRKNSPLIYVGAARDGEGKTIEQILSDANLQHLHQYNIDNFESVRALVVEGLGIGVLPKRMAKPYTQNGTLVSVSLPGIGKTFGPHRFYCSFLTQDVNDVRISHVVRDLREWCSVHHRRI